MRLLLCRLGSFFWWGFSMAAAALPPACDLLLVVLLLRRPRRPGRVVVVRGEKETPRPKRDIFNILVFMYWWRDKGVQHLKKA